jgi:hypothetical protein
MALDTYAGLKASIASWLQRTDLTARIPDFVALAESDLRKDIRVQAMEQLETGTLTGETLAHPTRYIEARRLTIDGDNYRYVPPEVYAAAVDADSTQLLFTSIGQSFYILNGASGDAYTLVYYQAFAALSDDADTNWLLTNHPGVYLWASCAYAAAFTQDPSQGFMAQYQDAAGRLMAADKRSSVSGSPLVIRTTTTE